MVCYGISGVVNCLLIMIFHTKAAQICEFPREFVTLMVAQFVLKIAHLAILISLFTDPLFSLQNPSSARDKK